ncbi:hypothetical protein LUZ60_015147 [Juncus effusus]|nr:hypothetical protein LUZ60_015147 [Juncus effusus]
MISPPQFFGIQIPSPSPPPSPTSASSLRPITATIATPPSPTARSSPTSLYEILGIPVTASFPEIKSAYRTLARSCHPDMSRDNSSDQFMRLHTAYATLSNPDERAAYDRRLLVQGRQASPPRQQMNATTYRRHANFSRSPSFPGVYGRNRRTWETDQCW